MFLETRFWMNSNEAVPQISTPFWEVSVVGPLPVIVDIVMAHVVPGSMHSIPFFW